MANSSNHFFDLSSIITSTSMPAVTNNKLNDDPELKLLQPEALLPDTKLQLLLPPQPPETLQPDPHQCENSSHSSSSSSSSSYSGDDSDDLYQQLKEEALDVLQNEPELALLLQRTVLAPWVTCFEDAVATTVCYRLLQQPCHQQASGRGGGILRSCMSNDQASSNSNTMFCPNSLRGILRSCMSNETCLELGHSMSYAIRQDTLAVQKRDPAMDTILEVLLFSKGYSALVCHRAAYRLWFQKKKFTALLLQSQASAVFGLDIHPRAQLGCRVMLDHGTGIVIGETATVGDGCTLLHGVTLGGTGKDHGDRHPKIGKNVLIGAGSSILGNITVGDGAKIGAGSVVLRPIPSHATAVGAPARIIGRVVEPKPGSEMNHTLENVNLLHHDTTDSTATLTELSEDETLASSNKLESSNDEDDDDNYKGASTRTSSASPITSSPVCPFRNYTLMARYAPPGAITICTLGSILKPADCAINEIGSAFFELDTKNVGHVTLDYFRDHAARVLAKNTKLEPSQVNKIVNEYLETTTAAHSKKKKTTKSTTEHKTNPVDVLRESLVPS